MHAAFRADRVDGDDVGVVQLRGGLRLDAEASEPAGIDGRAEGKHLEGDAPVERALHGFVDDAHSAAAQRADDAEITECRSVAAGFSFDRRGSERRRRIPRPYAGL